jgi:hypothetical protein
MRRNRVDRLQPGQGRAKIAALACGKGMNFVDDHALQPGEEVRAVGIAEQERQRFRCRQQDVRRPRALACLALGRGITAARLDAQGQADFLHRRQQVALHIMGQSLERRDIERVQPFGWGHVPSREGAKAASVGRNPASVLPAPVSATSKA